MNAVEKVETIVKLTLARLEITTLKYSDGGYNWSMISKEGKEQIEKTLIEIDELLLEIRGDQVGIINKNTLLYLNILELEKDRMEWALKNFPEATAISSLRKLEGEIKEVEGEINKAMNIGDSDLEEEYADCLMCLFDSAGRIGITPVMIFKAFAKKLEKNKNRTWIKNPDNTYSHVKEK